MRNSFQASGEVWEMVGNELILVLPASGLEKVTAEFQGRVVRHLQTASPAFAQALAGSETTDRAIGPQ
jgi:hypothetical protein